MVTIVDCTGNRTVLYNLITSEEQRDLKDVMSKPNFIELMGSEVTIPKFHFNSAYSFRTNPALLYLVRVGLNPVLKFFSGMKFSKLTFFPRYREATNILSIANDYYSRFATCEGFVATTECN